MSLRLGDKIIAGVVPNTSAFATKTELNTKADTKADTNLSNVSSNIDYVTETYISDDYTSWYRKYKSGWVEQGGGLVARNQTITFLVPMKNANYTALCNTNSDQGYARNLMSSNTTTSISIRADGGSMWWYVCGQSA